MNEGITRLPGTVDAGKAPKSSQSISELHQPPSSAVRGVRCAHPMVQVNLDLAPSSPAMICQACDQRPVILLGREEIGVTERSPVAVTPIVRHLRIFVTPTFEPSPLFL